MAGVADAGDRAQQRLGVGHGHLGEEHAVGARSTTLPAYITMISSVRVATTPRSWVTRTMPISRSRCRRAQQVQDLRLHGDVEAGGRLVRHEQPGGAGQGDGDDHPLAHAARQLVGVGVVAFHRGGDPDLHEKGERGLLGLVPVQA